jgi:hypothetical protein
MAVQTIHVDRDTAIDIIADAWGMPRAKLARLSAVELDRILCTPDVASKAMEMLSSSSERKAS